MIKKCPKCRSSKFTSNEKGEWGCSKCPYVWRPNNLIELELIKSEQEVKK